MKTSRQITIDIEIHEKLRNEANASDLINELLKKHYAQDLTKMELEEEKLKVEALINEQQNKLSRINKELIKINSNPLKDTIIRYT